ncbi:unnamed protein product, partial [Heterosigma akashiwo]
KSVGPDGVSPLVLKHCARHLARPLTRFFQKVGKSGEFPGAGRWQGSPLSIRRRMPASRRTTGRSR